MRFSNGFRRFGVAVALSFGCLAILSTWVGAAAAQGAGGDVKLVTVAKQRITEGAVSRYKLDMKLNVRGANGGQAFVTMMQFKQTCSAAKPSGEHTLTYVFEAGGLKMGATLEAAAKADETDILTSLPTVTVVTDSAGAAKASFGGGTEQGNAELGGILQQFAASPEAFRPPHPVKVGDKWKLAYTNANKLIGAEKIEGEAEVIGPETIGAFNTLKIHVKAGDPPSGDTPKPGFEGVVNLDPATGRIIKLTQKGNGEFAGGPASVELTVTLADNREVKL